MLHWYRKYVDTNLYCIVTALTLTTTQERKKIDIFDNEITESPHPAIGKVGFIGFRSLVA